MARAGLSRMFSGAVCAVVAGNSGSSCENRRARETGEVSGSVAMGDCRRFVVPMLSRCIIDSPRPAAIWRD